MKLKSRTVAGVFIVFVIGAGLTGCKSDAGGVRKFDTADSPINMGGGSIYANIKPGGIWNKVPGKKSKEYTTTSNNIDLIFTDGVQNVTTIPSQPNGWMITLSNTDENGTPKADAITICPEQDCKAGPLSGKKTIYLTTRKDSRWTLNPRTNQLRFHDNECDGDDEDGTSEEPACDFLLTVTIKDSTGTTIASGSCKDSSGIDGYCKIGIGKP
jgi:hypothetical protein